MWRWLALLLAAAAAVATGQDWKPLFDGKNLGSWRETPFARHGEVRVQNGALILGRGAPMTGVTWTAAFPHSNYEIRFEASRIEGGDFFASLTFPVEDTFCTWVTGGWGGDIVGLSSLDGWDASDNETRTYFNFEQGRWYKLRLLVKPDRIRAWIDEEPVINVSITGRNVSLRPGDTKLTTPLGFMSYGTTGGIRKVEFRDLKASK